MNIHVYSKTHPFGACLYEFNHLFIFFFAFENRNNKYTYNSWRPVTAIANSTYTSWHTTYNLPQSSSWLSLLDTPPHPEYLSGHSTFSAAAGEVKLIHRHHHHHHHHL